MSIHEKLTRLVEAMNSNPTHLSSLNAFYGFEIKDQEENYSVKFEQNRVELLEELIENTDCTLRLKGKHLEELIDGTLNATSAFMMGKIKVDGDLTLALKLQNILKEYRQ
ncbi:sterol carrier protein [Halalkalibacillus sediminis]|uniref:Sterol carrier protein n=1 Tax=Halalkalibacillus sediminis TaxID=2018042 RepID=A0A2I0QWR9_9BACI|nr:SCP2 sterol-binding domain-containing protein [Halalkalibacillus sediminis]PKR78783.1 sterol carrier protein [Halalkalibacillus sediminis]